MTAYFVDHNTPEAPLETRAGGAFEGFGNPIFDIDRLGSQTESGQTINDVRTLQHPPIYQLLSKITGDVCRLDIALHQRTGPNSSLELTDHPLTKLVTNPNNEQNHRKFWRRAFLHLLLYGNLYVKVTRNQFDGSPRKLTLGLPDRSHAQRPNGDDLVYQLGYDHRPWNEFVAPLDVIHCELLQDVALGFMGINQWSTMRNTTGLGLAQEQFMGKFYRRGGRPGGFLIIPDGTTPESATNLVRQFRRFYENPDEAFKVLPLHDGADFRDAQHTFRDTEMIDSKQDNARDASRFYNVRPSEIGLPDSVSYNSRSDDARAYVDSTILPLTRSVEAELDFRLLLPGQRARGLFFRWDTTQMIQMDFVSRTNAHAIAIQNRVMTRNEVRARENLPPVVGGDEFDEPATTPAGDGGDSEDGTQNTSSASANGKNGRREPAAA